jgi:TolA-binding protein
MKELFVLKRLALLSLVIGLVCLFSCAGSNDDSINLDEEGFATETEGEQTSGDEADEDEVLRLLGLSEEQEEGGTVADSEKSVDELEEKVVDLEQEINQKNVQVANLKAELAERERRIQDLQDDVTETSGTGSTTVTFSGSGSGSFKERYDYALSLYNNRQYRAALQEFDELVRMGGQPNLEDNCQYWKGECYYGLQEYNQAIIEFEKVFVYNNSNKYDDSQLKLGLCYLKLGNIEKARDEFQKLINNYPDSEYVYKAESYLSSF